MEDKRALRAVIRKEIEGFDSEYIKRSNEAVFHALVSLPELKRAKRVFCYFSVGREVDTHGIMDCLINQGKEIYLPVVLDGGIMYAVHAENLSNMYSGKLDIPEPARDGKKLISTVEDIALVPALAYDQRGYRLGQGGGYYDRYLADWKGVSVGLCRGRLLKRNLLIEPHDMRVDVLIADDKITRPL